MPALVEGEITPAGSKSIVLSNKATSEHITINPEDSGKFKALVPAGEYAIQFDSASRVLTLLSGMKYTLNLNPEKNIDFVATVDSQDIEKKIVRIKVIAEGKGKHTLSIRCFNGEVSEHEKELSLEEGEKAEIDWDIHITNPKIPWVTVIIPDGNLVWKQTLTGSGI